MGATIQGKSRINTSLITLKLVTFFVISGLSALHILNSRQPEIWGLNFEEFRLINIIIPVITIIGPLIAGPLADKLAAKNPATFGRNIRLITAIFLALACIFYGCLLAIPAVHREEARRPRVSFSCDSSGAEIFQERCTEEIQQCHHWSREKIGSLILTNCSYTCQNPNKFENLYSPWMKGSPIPPTEVSAESDYHDADYDENVSQTSTESLRPRRQVNNEDEGRELTSAEHVPDKVFVEPPHLCTKRTEDDGRQVIDKCHVYTIDTVNLKVLATLRSATNNENNTHSEEWCNYPLDGYQCNVPELQAKWMAAVTNSSNCKATVECDVFDPYDSPGSVLADSQCIRTIGDIDTTFWGYFVLRGIGEIFLLAVLTLLNTAIIIAVRDTSEGRGEVCRQYVWGAIGYVIILAPINYAFGQSHDQDSITIAIIATVVALICFLIAAIILLFANKMPLSPPEWWWHTKTGMLVYPMSAIRRYGPEMLVLTIIATIFGMFWSSIHTYLRWAYIDYNSATCSALLFVILLFFNADKFIEYCGHSNILIGGFAIFIIRFTALAENIEWLTVTMEIIEPLAIGLIWITIILYMRHIMPRKFTATGQAIAVIAFFCLGKCFGALIGLVKDVKKPGYDNCMYHGLAIAACIIAIIYFIMYNIILAPRCAAKPQPAPQLNLSSQPPTNGAGSGRQNNNEGSGGTTNGNYTPLRVYHNERGKKNQFRY